MLLRFLPALGRLLSWPHAAQRYVDQRRSAAGRDGRSGQRKQEAQGDLGRTRNQQRFLAALARKAATPATLADPSKSFPTLDAGLDTPIVDEGTELPDLMGLCEALRKATGGGGRRIDVPVADPDLRTSKGSAVKWDDRRARALFDALREDRLPS
ncbi:hypothetical protein ACFV20_03120 [Streptomyces sp. NPDC059696]|uniref:hypothetical protein n=1 Tax=Streptomyces sp. NPDC059696 TaxID=3346911 RepID=UPI0036C0C4E3